MLIDKVPVEDIKERIQSVLSRDDSYRAREDETIINKLSQKSVAATLEAAHVISIDKVLKNMSFEF